MNYLKKKEMIDIRDTIHDYVSTHECEVSNGVHNRDENIKVTFTRFGNRAAQKALIEVVDMLDEETQKKVVDMMNNRRVIT